MILMDLLISGVDCAIILRNKYLFEIRLYLFWRAGAALPVSRIDWEDSVIVKLTELLHALAAVAALVFILILLFR